MVHFDWCHIRHHCSFITKSKDSHRPDKPGTKRKRKSKRQFCKVAPDGWHTWPIVLKDYFPRVPMFEQPLLEMSYHDPRATGHGPKDAYLYEDPTNVGGKYRQNEHLLHMVPPQTLIQNSPVLLPFSKASEASGKYRLPKPKPT
jgi:hypothetical protein